MPGCDFQLPSFSVQMPGKGKTDMCCNACVFGQGDHEIWCSSAAKTTPRNEHGQYVNDPELHELYPVWKDEKR